MSFVTINSTKYLVRVGQESGQPLVVENRRRAIDASLLVDSIAVKQRITIEFSGLASAKRFFTFSEANALVDTLLAGNVTVGGDVGSFTARATNVSLSSGQDWSTGSPVPYRWVSATLEEV